MELDGVYKFESFISMNESLIGINKSNIEHEKVLADYYSLVIGHVELIDSEIHLYKINDFGKKVTSIIFSDSEIEEIKGKICDSNDH
jgi:hypothetical protein